MKQKISVSIGEEILDILDEAVKEGSFRNRSHAFEYSLKKQLEAKNEN